MSNSLRAYWNDTQCQQYYTMLIRVYLPNVPCQSTTPLNGICEQKSTGTLKSSEGTGCDTAQQSEDSVWLPTIPTRAPGNYLSLTKYSTQNCDKSATFEQNTFLANGNCFAVEGRESFFKATCSENSGDLQICKDPLCSVPMLIRIVQEPFSMLVVSNNNPSNSLQINAIMA